MMRKLTNQYTKSLCFVLFYLVLSAPLVANAAVRNAKPVQINFFVDDDKDSVVKAIGIKFQELVKKKIGNNVVQVKLHSLGDRDLFEEMRVGNTQMIAPKLSRLKRYSKRLQVFELPFIFYSEKAASNFLDGEWGERLLILLKRQGVNAHGYVHQGMKHMTSDNAIVLPSDAVNKSIGIFNSNTSKQYFKQVGLNIVPINDIEQAAALTNNSINITESNWKRIYNQSLYKQHRYILESNHTYTGNVVITSNDIWAKIPAKVTPVLEKIIQESIEYGNNYSRKRNDAYRQAISNTGTISELAARDRYLWIEAASQIWALYEDDIGSQLIAAAASHR